MNHVHISAATALSTILVVIVFAFIWRSLSARWSEKPIGQAMAFIL